MKRSVLVVMIDVLVLSVLTLTLRTGKLGSVLPLYRWSSVIEAGLIKEKEYIRQLREMQAQLEAARKAELEARAQEAAARESEREARIAEELARRMEEESKRKAAEAESAAKEAEVQARVAIEREQEARLKATQAEEDAKRALTQAEQAAEIARKAELEAKTAEERHRLALAEAEAVRQREQEAIAKALAAEKRAAEARVLAETAFTREQESVLSSAEAKAKEVAAETRADLAQIEAFAAKVKAGRMEMSIQEAQQIKAQAEEEKAKAEEEIRLSRQKEAEALEKARELEIAKIMAQEQAAKAREQAAAMKDLLAETAVREKVAKAELEIKEKEKKAAEEMLAKARESGKGSIWLRDRALRRLHVRIRTEDIGTFPSTKESTLYLPAFKLGSAFFVASDFESLMFGDRSVQSGGYVTTLELHASDISGANAAPLQNPVAVSPSEPRICFIMLPGQTNGLVPLGMEGLKQKSVQEAVLFKADEPEKSLQVFLTPARAGDYVMVTPQESGRFTLARRIRPEVGDYILTPNGDFVGIMVSKEKCFVPAPTLLDASKVKVIPLKKLPGDRVFSDFVTAAREVANLIKLIKD